MSDFNCCLNHPTDPWRLLFFGQHPRVPDNGSIWLALSKTDKPTQNDYFHEKVSTITWFHSILCRASNDQRFDENS